MNTLSVPVRAVLVFSPECTIKVMLSLSRIELLLHGTRYVAPSDCFGQVRFVSCQRSHYLVPCVITFCRGNPQPCARSLYLWTKISHVVGLCHVTVNSWYRVRCRIRHDLQNNCSVTVRKRSTYVSEYSKDLYFFTLAILLAEMIWNISYEICVDTIEKRFAYRLQYCGMHGNIYQITLYLYSHNDIRTIIPFSSPQIYHPKICAAVVSIGVYALWKHQQYHWQQ